MSYLKYNTANLVVNTVIVDDTIYPITGHMLIINHRLLTLPWIAKCRILP